MQLSSRFTIAIHILTCIETFKNDFKLTSEFMAGSINANPVIIRRILQQLKAAGIITVARGSGGALLAKPAEEITFLDIYNAVECVDGGALFHFHEEPNHDCPVGRNIHKALDGKLSEIQKAMEEKMSQMTVADVTNDVNFLIDTEGENE